MSDSYQEMCKFINVAVFPTLAQLIKFMRETPGILRKKHKFDEVGEKFREQLLLVIHAFLNLQTLPITCAIIILK